MCCIIILSHFEFLGKSETFGEFYMTYLHNATLAVDYFFMLSGFGIYLSLKRPECSIKGALYFAVDKVKKIYPAYIFSLLMGIPATIYTLLKYSSIGKAVLKLLFFCGVDLSLLQSITGMTRFSHAVNDVCWFLSTIFISYIVCPWILRVVDKVRNKRQAFSLICGFVIIVLILSFGAILTERNIQGIFDDLWYGHPIIRCWYLAIGMCLGYLYKESTIQIRSGQEVFVAGLAIFYFVGRNSIPFGKEVLRVFDITLCILFLYVFACGNGKLSRKLSSERMVNLGKISMLLFLFHYPIRIIFGTIFANVGWQSDWMLFAEMSLIIFITVLIVSLYGVASSWVKAHLSGT